MYRQSQVKEDCSQEEGGGAVFERWFKGRIPLVNHSLVKQRGLQNSKEVMSHAVRGPPHMDGSEWRVLSKHGPLEEGTAKHSSILAMRTP